MMKLIEGVGIWLFVEFWDGLIYQDIFDIDECFYLVLDIVCEYWVFDFGMQLYSVVCYIDFGFFCKEVEYVFFKIWQYVCCEEEIVWVGDVYLFELVD